MFMVKSSLMQNKLCLQTDLMKDESSVLNKNFSLIGVDERHNV